MTDASEDEENIDNYSFRSSEFPQVKFFKKKELASVDWKGINRKLEEHYRLKEQQKADDQDLLFSMYDEPGDRLRTSIAGLNPSSIKKLKEMVQLKKELRSDSYKRTVEGRKKSQEFLKEFQSINEILENKRNLKEKDLEKLLLVPNSSILHFRQNSEPNLQTSSFQQSRSNKASKFIERKLPKRIEYSRLSQEPKSLSIDRNTYFDTPLLERKKLESLQMLRSFENRDNMFLKIAHNLNEKLEFETNPQRIRENFEQITTPFEKKIINSYAFSSNFFTSPHSINTSNTVEFFKTMQERPPPPSTKSKLVSMAPTRTDVEALDKWLDVMLQNLFSSSITSIHEYFHMIQVIYSCCLQELIRQVSLECKDRGHLLKKIWNAYISILENVIMEESKTQQQKEKDYLEEITKVHKMYQTEIENNRNYVENTKTENLKLAEIAKTYKENQKFLKKAYRHFEKDYKLIKQQLEASYNEIKVLVDENSKLKILLDFQIDEKTGSQTIDQLFLSTMRASTLEKSVEDFNILASNKTLGKRPKSKTVALMNKNQHKKSVLQTLKEKENLSKSVDTFGLIDTWDSSANTDLIYGTKFISFVDKITQTVERSTEQTVENIKETLAQINMKTEENTQAIQENEEKQKESEEKIDEKTSFEIQKETIAERIENQQIHVPQNEENAKENEEVEEEKNTRRKGSKSPRKKQFADRSSPKKATTPKTMNATQKKIQFEFSAQDETKLKTPQKVQKISSEEKLDRKKPKDKANNNLRTQKHPENENSEKERDPKSKAKALFFPEFNDQKPEEKQKEILVKPGVAISKLRTIIEENENTPRVPEERINQNTNPNTENLDKKTGLSLDREQITAFNQKQSSFQNIMDQIKFGNSRPPSENIIKTEGNDTSDILKNSMQEFLSSISSETMKEMKPPILSKFSFSATQENPKYLPKSTLSMQNEMNSSINVVESRIIPNPKNRNSMLRSSKTEGLNLETGSKSSLSKSNHSSEKDENEPNLDTGLPYSKLIPPLRESSKKKQSKQSNDETLLKRLVKAEENETEKYELKVELNKLKKVFDENVANLKETTAKLEKAGILNRELKKTIDESTQKINDLELQKKVMTMKHKNIKRFFLILQASLILNNDPEKSSLGFKDKLSIFAETLLEKLLRELRSNNNLTLHTGGAVSSFHSGQGSNPDNSVPENFIKKEKEIVSPVMQYIKKTNTVQKTADPLNMNDLKEKICPENQNLSAEKNFKMVIYRSPQAKNVKVNMYDDLSKKKIDNLISMNTEIALVLQKKALQKIKTSGTKSYFTRTALLKLISLIYSDKIKNPQNRYNPLLVISYDFTLNRYGIKKIADTKYSQFLETCCCYSDTFRIQMFSRFLKLFDKFENEEFDFYMKCLKSLDEV